MPKPRKSRRTRRLTATLTTLAALFAPAALAQGATLEVSAADGNDSGNCIATPCATIPFAVAAANPGDTIAVAAGTYDETAVVGKPLTIEGAQAGVAAPGRSGSESVIDAPGGAFSVQSDDVAIDGFTIEGAAGPPLGSGIYLSPLISGYAIVNNRIRGNVIGLYGNASGVEPSLVQGNSFEDNNLPGSASGTGIYADQGTTELIVSDNSFSGHEKAAMVFAGAEQESISVLDNEIEEDGGIVFFNSADVSIEGNLNSAPWGSGIVLGGANDGVQIAGNRIVDAGMAAVRLGASGGSNSAVELVGNQLVGNPAGVGLEADGYSGPVPAAGNWWGCNAGPGAPGCDSVSAGVDAGDWLRLRVAATPQAFTAGSESTIVASLVREGEEAAAPTFDGVPVSFVTELGELSPPQALLAGGAAVTVLRSAVPGTANVTASLDGEAVTIPVGIDPVPAPPEDPPESPPAPKPEPSPTPPAPPAVKPSGNGAPKVVGGGGQVSVATVTCPAASCEVAARKPQVQIGGRSYKLKVKLPANLGSGDSAPIRVVLPRKAREALAEKGRGKVRLTLTVTASDGTTKTVRVTLTVRGPGKKRGS